MKGDIWKMDNKIGGIQQMITKIEQRIQNVEVRAEQTEKKMEQKEQKLTSASRDFEDTIIFLEMEKAAFYLRFQNIVEDNFRSMRIAATKWQIQRRDTEHL